MENTIYLLDNMVICSKPIAPYIRSDFFQSNVWIIDEVIHEARNSKSIEFIKKLRHSIEAKECEKLKQIALACIEQFKILKLYEGCADALLLSTALAINENDEHQKKFQFDRITPIIVTQEKGIRRACDTFNIKWITQASFVHLAKQFTKYELPLGQ